MRLKRNANLINFIVNNNVNCYRAFKVFFFFIGFKSEEGSKLVKLAREQMNYSLKTWDGDIYTAIWRYYKAIVIDGIEL